MPDAEGAQSPPAAHRDDSLATNSSAGLVAEDHPPKRRRGGWGRAGVFAVAAWLAWLAWPTAAFAQATLTLSVDDDIAGDDTINIAEKANGFPISGNTGAVSGVTVTVNVNGTPVLTATSDAGGAWSVDVDKNEGYITGTSVLLSVTATKTGSTSATPVSRTLKVDLTAPTVSYTAPLSLTVGDAIIAMGPTKSEDIDSYAISADPLLRGLSLNGATGVISGTPTTGNRNTQTVEVLATDEAGNTGTAMIDFPLVRGPEAGVTVDPPREELPEEGLFVPEGGSVQYTLVLDTEPTHEVTIRVSLTTSDDDLTAAPTTLTFTTGNWDVERTVTVSAADDDDGEAGIATIAHNAVSDDSVYDGIPTPGVKATEDDDDSIGVKVSPTTLSVPEGGSATYTVRLGTKPLSDVTVEATRDQRSDVDLTVSSDTDTDTDTDSVTLTFTNSNWNTEQTVTVSAAEDDADEVDGVATFSHTTASDDDDYYPIDVDPVTATEADNDSIGVKVSPTTLSVPEGGSATYTVRLGTKPLSDVTVEATPDQGSDDDLTVSSDTDTDTDTDSVTLTFTNSNWNTEQTVTVSAAEDDADEVDGVATFSHTTASGDDDYYPIDVDPVTATEADNDKDVIKPTAEIQTEASAPVDGAFEVTIRFSENVRGFTLRDIGVSNGTASKFNKVSSRRYTVTITPEESGEVRVEVRSNVARDGAGNGNRAAEPLVIEADLERPEVTIAGPTEPVVMARFEVTITFSKPVEGFEPEDIQVSNGMVSDFTEVSSSEYRATIKPAEAGQTVVVEVPEDVAEDRSGNGNRAAEPFEVEAKPVVSYQEEDYTATEGGETVSVTVKLSQAGDEELAIPIRVTRPETTEVGDYTVEGLEDWDARAGTGTLTFPADATQQTWSIAANHDGDGDDETLELGFGELPEMVGAGEPSVATVMLEDKGLVELKVSFGQAEYTVMEGQQADIEMKMSPTADRRVEVPLVVAPKGGATDEDYSGVPAKVVFEEGESEGTISVEVLADEVNDPGEGVVLSFGGLPEAVSSGAPSPTQVHFGQRRMAEQFSQTLEVMEAVIARSMGESVQRAIEGRFERYRQWSRLGPSVGAMLPPQRGSDNRVAAQGPGEPEQTGSDSAGGRGAEGSVVQSASGAAKTSAATESGWNSENRGTRTPGSWLRSLSMGSLGNVVRSGQTHLGASPGSGMEPGGRVYGQDRQYGSGVGDAPLGPDSGDFLGMRDLRLSLSEVSFEISPGESEKETSWVPVLWGQGNLRHFNGDLSRLGMNYRGGLEAGHLGVDLYANKQMLAGLSFMRTWGDMDYTDDGVDGVLESDLNTVHPYLYWQLNERMSVWGIGGLGTGQVEVREPGRTHDFDADFRMLAGGVRAVLSRRGNNEWGLRADAFTAQLATDASEDIAKVSGEAHRGRLMLEWVHERAPSAGRALSVQAEAGGRFDGGDADRGAGVETGVRLGYLDANSGLDAALHGRVLVVHESDYRDWGAGVQASWDPGEKQRGFRASVMSSWGQDGGGRTTLWNNADAVKRPAGMGAMGIGSQYRMEGQVAYGGLKTLGLPGLLTPYSRLRWAGQGRELAWGTAWSLPPRSQLALPLMLELEAVRRETGTGPADLGVLMRMSIPF